jgi:putative ATP-dependent endonuclease of OLD family
MRGVNKMRISRLSTTNYRTLQQLDLNFAPYYTAICGRNDTGKTNVVQVIRCLMKEHDPYNYGEDPEFSINEDFTKWVKVEQRDREISVAMDLIIHPQTDKGLHEFLRDYLGIGDQNQELAVRIDICHKSDAPQDVIVTVGDQRFEELKAQEVLKRVQTSRSFLFHSSMEPRGRYSRALRGILGDIPEDYAKRLGASEKAVNTVLKRIAREQSQEIENLLGRLKERYKVGLSFPSFDLSFFPYDLTLGDHKVDVELDEWGSGTRNRTLVLLTIFRAKLVADSTTSASKVTPIIVIEEPESFLHPSAQAEFGRVIQDLAEEFKVQIIVTTHSPYLLSQNKPESNILLERKLVRRQIRETVRVDTSGERWMEPYAVSLGIRDKEFMFWRDAFFTTSKALLLVEGEIDKEYFELLRNPIHGENALQFQGDISFYGGRDSIKNQAILRLIRDRFPKLFITYDLDSDDMLRSSLEALGFERRKHYLPIGIDVAGKRCIEGLLPEDIQREVYARNPGIVQASLAGTPDEKKSAKSTLKRLLFEEFRQKALPGEEYFGGFYQIVKIANRALS